MTENTLHSAGRSLWPAGRPRGVAARVGGYPPEPERFKGASGGELGGICGENGDVTDVTQVY